MLVTVEAGAAPDPAVVTAGAAAGKAAPISPASVKPSEPAGEPPATDKTKAPAATQASPQAVASGAKLTAAEEPVGAQPPTGQEAGSPLGWLVGGVLLLGGLVVQMLRRR